MGCCKEVVPKRCWLRSGGAGDGQLLWGGIKEVHNHGYLHWKKIQNQNSKSEAIRFQIPPRLTVSFHVGPVSKQNFMPTSPL